LDYEGKRAVVSGGGGSGMGAATVVALQSLGAETHGIELKPPPTEVASYRAVDLRDPEATAGWRVKRTDETTVHLDLESPSPAQLEALARVAG
jgi:NAD(P)-dependent dehydrogenase (short-subunit alcohol dehydrogenase family)